ncbi:hypothetical protein DFQ28_001808 [Apophysomyces sp. BC1034]|nr:hypothetical protein DFQ30_002407 [Apophysomyces sp. BC1015]KAG0180756.1 hypothetical protein DFQ29_010197 [Apophysomyces sp. BC1021]KAG0190601.1 hypothetical protein DFQ28_001808 [Apophysomyces sp. BC1034]
MAELPWGEDAQLNLSELLGQSMASAETIVTDHELSQRVSSHLNLLLKKKRGPPPQALAVMNKMFATASESMESETDKQVLAWLKTCMSCFVGTSVGVRDFLPQNQPKELPEAEETEQTEHHHASWADVVAHHAEKESDERQDQDNLGFPALGAPDSPRPSRYSGHHDEDVDYAVHVERARLRKLTLEYNNDEEHDENKEEEEEDGFRSVHHENHRRCILHRRRRGRYNVNPVDFEPTLLDELPSGTYCMPIFFPSEDSYLTFISVLASAQESLLVCVFSLTDDNTADVLIDAKDRGVDVRIVTDNDQMDERKGADTQRLHDSFGIPYKMDNSDQFMHNKFAVIDRKVVLTGSFNWSIGARFKNRENVIVTNIPSVVEAYSDEFERLWSTF